MHVSVKGIPCGRAPSGEIKTMSICMIPILTNSKFTLTTLI